LLTVLPDDDDDSDPAGLHDLPSGLRTPPTPPADHSQSAEASAIPRRLRAVVQLRPVSIPEIVRDMTGKNPRQTIADFDRHYMPDGVPEPEAPVDGNANEHRSSLKRKAEDISRSLRKVFAFLTDRQIASLTV
jgi:hypothetical protein